MARGEQGANTAPAGAERCAANDRGEGAVNHLVVLLLIGLVAGALVTANLGTWVVGGIGYAICRVANAGDAAACESPADRELRPACLTFLAANSYGGTIDVLIFRVGKDYSFLRTTTIAPDGTKTVTITAIKGGTAGVGTGVGVGINAGNLANLGADASIDAQVRLGTGDGWEFTGPDAESRADDFEADLREQYQIDGVKENGGPLGWVGGSVYDAVAAPTRSTPTPRPGSASTPTRRRSCRPTSGPARPR
jgi:hypothetical protein